MANVDVIARGLALKNRHDMQKLVIGEFGTGFITDEMLSQEGVKGQVSELSVKISELTDARISRDKVHASLNDRLLYDVKYLERYLLNMQIIPTIALTPEEMTDTTLNYVYQGTTTGDYWYGNWYYWDGEVWKRGGIYRPVTATEVIIARDSLTKGKIFPSLDARLEESETELKQLQTIVNNAIPKIKYPSPANISATYYPTNSNVACQIKADVIIGYMFNRVTKSLDGGITWVDFAPTMPNLPVNGQYVNLMDDGHLLVFGIEIATNDGVILRSSNTNFDATTTWVEIKRITGKSFASGNPFGININGHIVLGSTYPSNSPVFISTDYGQTFRDIFTKAITHVHTTYIDPYDKTIWVATGDGTIHRNLYYSKDWGNTWNSVWAEGTAPTQITSIISRPECVLFGTDVSNEYAVWRYDKKKQEISKVFFGGTTEASTACSLGVMPYNQESNDGIITWLPFQAENDTKRWRLVATPDGINYYVIDEPASLTTDKNLVSVVGVYNNKLIVRTAGSYIAHYILPEWKE
jgi:hypothetical protein